MSTGIPNHFYRYQLLIRSRIVGTIARVGSQVARGLKVGTIAGVGSQIGC